MEVHHLIQYIHQLLRHEALDDLVLGNLIDDETITLLRQHPVIPSLAIGQWSNFALSLTVL